MLFGTCSVIWHTTAAHRVASNKLMTVQGNAWLLGLIKHKALVNGQTDNPKFGERNPHLLLVWNSKFNNTF